MNLINKKVCRGISILILLTLYLGLCFEAAALEEMAIGEFHGLEGGYSIKVEEADVESGKAVFVLGLPGGKEGLLQTVNTGETFSFDGDFFNYEATLAFVAYSLYWIIFLICCLAIGLPIFLIIYRKRKRPSGGQKQKPIGPDVNAQKIEEYRAKMEEWEKDGYDVSALKEVLEGKG